MIACCLFLPVGDMKSARNGAWDNKEHALVILPVAHRVKILLATWETQVQSPGREDLLEKEMATHSSTLAWKNLMDGGAWQAIVHGVTKTWTRLSDRHTH